MGSTDETGTNEENETFRTGFDLQTVMGEIAKGKKNWVESCYEIPALIDLAPSERAPKHTIPFTP